MAKKQKDYISPINKGKIRALADIYHELPSNSFSKLVVTYCIFFATIVIIASFVLLVLGYDTSSILQCSLLFLGGELLTLGATNIFRKEQTKEDLVFDVIRDSLNDGIYYDKDGKKVCSEDEYIESDNTNTVTEIVTTNTFTETKMVTETQEEEQPKKKRGRPKKEVSKSISKSKNNYKITNDGNIELTSSIEQDGRD